VAKLFIATPMYGGQNYGYFNQSMLQLQAMMMQNNVNMAVSYLFNESLIQRARNALVHNFLKTDFTHLMFIDADIRFNPQDILRMLLADKPILCGVYPKKEINWGQVHAAAQANVPADKLHLFSGSFVVNLVNYANETSVNVNEPLEIWNGGTGFMMIKREVIEKLQDKLPTYMNDTHDLSGSIGHERITEFFATSIEPDGERLLSEDYHFCKMWRDKCDGKVWAAPWAQLTHIGTYAFDGILMPSPEEFTKELINSDQLTPELITNN
jgi:hypothetical protein